MSEEPSRDLKVNVFSPETENIDKSANLTANTKNYGQITLKGNPHSDPLLRQAAITVCLPEATICLQWNPVITVTNRQKQFAALTGDCINKSCTVPEMIPTAKWSPNRPRNDTDPKIIPIALHVDPEMIPN